MSIVTTTTEEEEEEEPGGDAPAYKDLLRKQQIRSKFLCFAVLLCTLMSFLCLIAKSSNSKWIMGSIITAFTLCILTFWIVTGRLLKYYRLTRYPTLIVHDDDDDDEDDDDGYDDNVVESNKNFVKVDLDASASSSSSNSQEEEEEEEEEAEEDL